STAADPSARRVDTSNRPAMSSDPGESTLVGVGVPESTYPQSGSDLCSRPGPVGSTDHKLIQRPAHGVTVGGMFPTGNGPIEIQPHGGGTFDEFARGVEAVGDRPQRRDIDVRTLISHACLDAGHGGVVPGYFWLLTDSATRAASSRAVSSSAA